jgi:subtilisin family serine protease
VHYSNYGPVVDIFAPGDQIIAAAYIQNSGGRSSSFHSFNGTSAAAPLVTGVIAQYLQTHPLATPAQVEAWLKGNATTGKIDMNLTQTFDPTTAAASPNLLLRSYHL